jgi:hypothetical protein
VELLYGHDAVVIAWVERRYGFKFVPPCVALGIGDGSEIVGAVLWNDFSGPNIEGSCVGEARCFTRSIIREAFRYPFVQLGCQRVTVHIRRSNAKVRGLALRLGFRPEGLMRRYYGDDDAAVYGLLRAEAERWVR